MTSCKTIAFKFSKIEIRKVKWTIDFNRIWCVIIHVMIIFPIIKVLYALLEFLLNSNVVLLNSIGGKVFLECLFCYFFKVISLRNIIFSSSLVSYDKHVILVWLYLILCRHVSYMITLKTCMLDMLSWDQLRPLHRKSIRSSDMVITHM